VVVGGVGVLLVPPDRDPLAWGEVLGVLDSDADVVRHVVLLLLLLFGGAACDERAALDHSVQDCAGARGGDEVAVPSDRGAEALASQPRPQFTARPDLRGGGGLGRPGPERHARPRGVPAGLRGLLPLAAPALHDVAVRTA